MFKFASLMFVTLLGCSAVENAYNCDQICDKYRDCFDAAYDAEACQARCEQNADSANFADKAESCQACSDDRSCSGSFACVDECVGIVP